MTLSHYAIKALVPYFTGDEKPPYRGGPALVKLFNEYGVRDVYNNGLPVNPKTGQGMARKQYVESRLLMLSELNNLREIIEHVVNESEDPETTSSEINKILVPEKFSIQKMATLIT